MLSLIQSTMFDRKLSTKVRKIKLVSHLKIFILCDMKGKKMLKVSSLWEKVHQEKKKNRLVTLKCISF